MVPSSKEKQKERVLYHYFYLQSSLLFLIGSQYTTYAGLWLDLIIVMK